MATQSPVELSANCSPEQTGIQIRSTVSLKVTVPFVILGQRATHVRV